MKLNDIKESLGEYSTSWKVVVGKDENNLYFGNEYCTISTKLIDNLKQKELENLPVAETTFKKLIKQRMLLLEKEANKKVEIAEALKKRNVIGVSQRLSTGIRIDSKEGKLVTITSALKLAEGVSVDKRFSKLFNDHTFWYHPKDTTVFAIKKGINRVDGMLVRVTFPQSVSKEEKVNGSKTTKTSAKDTTCK